MAKIIVVTSGKGGVGKTTTSAAIAAGTGRLIFNSGTNGSQVTWDISDLTGNVLYSGGPYSNGELINIPLSFNQDCHKFEVQSTNGNGGGSILLRDENNQLLFQSNGNYGFGVSSSFNSLGNLDINDNNLEELRIYPNPATSVLNIKNAENATIEIYNILGQILYTKNEISIYEQIEVSQFTSGTYLMKIKNGNTVKTSKFVKK